MAKRPNGRSAIVPGQPQASELLRRVTMTGPGVMPPVASHKTLSAAEKELLRAWIAQGAEYRKHWAFIPPRRPALPVVKQKSWPANPIDSFVLTRLEKEGLQPSPPADPATLIRRVTLDLTGLPPAPEEVEAFVRECESESRAARSGERERVRERERSAPPTPKTQRLTSSSEAAYHRLVDRLLASPRFGEQMAWDWLDAARYADTNGYQGDRTRTMWIWRDWVVRAFNADKPFDQFTVEQLAGDLLPNATLDQKIATGFNRNHMLNGEGGRIAEESRIDYVVDRVDTTATVWMGVTLGCARCHDHKYDPFSQKEYYQLFAYFNNIAETGSVDRNGQANPVVPVPSAEQQQKLEELNGKVRSLEQQLGASAGSEKAALQKQIDDARKAVKDYENTLPLAMVMEELARPGDRRATHVLVKGAYDRKADQVSQGVPAIFPALPAGSESSNNRLALARWLVSPEHPLTARVAVNRYWQMLFGTGLVKTAEDFGVQGEAPSHPELLDYLATTFAGGNEALRARPGEMGKRSAVGGGSAAGIRAISPSPRFPISSPQGLGWSTKALLKLIVTSATYRQASRVSPALLARDPENRLLARGPRFRMTSAMIRDQALAASGLLVDKAGGPAVKPYQPAGVWEDATFGQIKYVQDKGEALYRRTLYTFWRRIVGPTNLFDTAARQNCSVRQVRTNTPLHALVLLNDITYVEAARALAQRVMLAETTPAARLDLAFRLVTARHPSAAERGVLLGRLDRLKARYAADPASAKKLLAVGESPRDEKLDAAEHAAYAALCTLLLNLDETVTKG
jgi:hypothetical protein